jgi:hypothetical protein
MTFDVSGFRHPLPSRRHQFPQVNSYFGVQPRRKNTTDPLARGEVVAMHLEYLRLGEGAKEPVPQGPASTRFKRGQEFNDIRYFHPVHRQAHHGSGQWRNGAR